MSNLEKAIKDLAAVATAADSSPQDVWPHVQNVINTADQADASTRNYLLQRMTEIMDQTDGPRVSLIAVGCGALVEEGGDPRIPVGPILKHLPAMLAEGARFYKACEALAKSEGEEISDEEGEEAADDDEDPVDQFGYQVSQEMPAEAVSWMHLEPMCTAAIAMLSRSPDVRRLARDNPLLILRALDLAEAHDRVAFLAKLLQVLDDEELIVLQPELVRGYRVQISGIADNFQLHTLLAGALIGDPKKGWLPGKRPDPRVVAAAKNQPVHRRAQVAKGAFNLWTWQGLQPDGTLPDALENSDYWIWNEGIPADIPSFEGVRIVLLGPPPYPRTWNADRCFGGMDADLRVLEILPSSTVQSWLHRIAQAPR